MPGTFVETQVIMNRLKQYGIAGRAREVPARRSSGTRVKGELWEMKPRLQKLASMHDMLPMLASGSQPTDVTAELVWVGRGTPAEIDAAKVEGKIVVTEGSIDQVHNYACNQKGALGVIAIAMSRPYFDPLQMPWAEHRRNARRQGGSAERSGRRRVTRRGQPPAAAANLPTARPAPPKPKFGFQLPVREGDFLKQRLMANEKITVQADRRIQAGKIQQREHRRRASPGPIRTPAKSSSRPTSSRASPSRAPTTTPPAAPPILEVARVLNTLIERGPPAEAEADHPLPVGARDLRDREVGQANKAIMDKTLCNINMDMVGEWLSKNQAFICLMRTTFGNPHYINDVMENYYRYVGEGNRERIQNRSDAYKVPVRIVAPFGADEPFWYSIETHYGASDHEVFNDWGVGVPGIMMIAWPDRWYHTSGDCADKSDATQLKRAAAIGAAGAYTVAARRRRHGRQDRRRDREQRRPPPRPLSRRRARSARTRPTGKNLLDAYQGAPGLRRGRDPERKGHARLGPAAGRRQGRRSALMSPR